MVHAPALRVVDRSATRKLAVETRWGSAFEAVLALRMLNGSLPLDQFEMGDRIGAMVGEGLPSNVATAIERLHTPTGDQWSALLGIALAAGPRYDVATLASMIEDMAPAALKAVMLRSDPEARSTHARGRGDEPDPPAAVPPRTLAHLVVAALRDLPDACFLASPDSLGLLERNALKAESALAGSDDIEVLIARLTNGAQFRAQPGIGRVVLIPTLVHRPWTLIDAFGDTQVFCYPARTDRELSAPDDVLIGVYRALGDGTRLRLLRRLVAGTATIARLGAELDLAKSTVHEHLLSLRAAGLVRSGPGGGYEIEPELPDLNWMLKEFLGLEMRRACERCGGGLELGAVAFICSYECTFCESCADDMRRVCPNCGGELVLRPRRGAARATVARTRRTHRRVGRRRVPVPHRDGL